MVLLNIFYVKRDKKLPKFTKFIVILSAAYDLITIKRLKVALSLLKKYPKAKLVVCGKEKANLMRSFLKTRGVSGFIVQDKSSNTFEDAKYLKDLLPEREKTNFILVTSASHQRRAYNTFKRVFLGKVWNYPTNDIFSFYSPLFPIGWLANLINLLKDLRYNKKSF